MRPALHWSGRRAYITRLSEAPSDPSLIGPRQLSGEACALCLADLALLVRTRLIGRLRVDIGTVREGICELWACAPDCGTVAAARLRAVSRARAAGAVWPPH